MKLTLDKSHFITGRGVKYLKISISKLLLWLTVFLCCSFDQIATFPVHYIRLVVSMIIILYCLLADRKYIINSNLDIIVYLLWIVFSTAISDKMKLFAAGEYCIALMAICFGVTLCSRIHGWKTATQCLYKAVVFCLLIFVIVLLMTSGKGLKVEDSLMHYGIGNKFVVSYFIMFVLAVSIQNFKPKRHIYVRFLRPIVLFIIALSLCGAIDCSTGILGCIVVFILHYAWKKYGTLMKQASVILTAVIIGGVFPFFASWLVSIPLIQLFIVNILHGDISLTGRIDIYSVLIGIIRKKLLFGYGYGNDIVQKVLTVGNPQNGLLQIITVSGLIGCVLFLFIMVDTFKKKKGLMVKSDSIVIFIYAMIVCSFGEINYGTFFLLCLTLLRNSREEEKMIL